MTWFKVGHSLNRKTLVIYKNHGQFDKISEFLSFQLYSFWLNLPKVVNTLEDPMQQSQIVHFPSLTYSPSSVCTDLTYVTLAKTEIIYPKNVGALEAMNFT